VSDLLDGAMPSGQQISLPRAAQDQPAEREVPSKAGAAKSSSAQQAFSTQWWNPRPPRNPRFSDNNAKFY